MLTFEELRRLVYDLLRLDSALSHPAMARNLAKVDADSGRPRRPLDQILWLCGVDVASTPKESATQAEREMSNAYNEVYEHVLDERSESTGALRGAPEGGTSCR